MFGLAVFDTIEAASNLDSLHSENLGTVAPVKENYYTMISKE